ncbi:hypothetical protein SLA2020_166920 [Shorea laevis]
MKVISWNCRGAANSEFRRTAMDIKKEHNPAIFVLMETKVAGSRAMEIAQGLGMPRCEIVDADGLAGGIWLLWDDMQVTIDILNKGAQVIHAMVKVISSPIFSNFYWFFYVVYGRPQFDMRSLLWDNLVQFSQNINGPWVAIGDFNDVTSQSEKFGGSPVPLFRIRAYTEYPFIPRVREKPFRLEKFWIDHHSFRDLVHANWIQTDSSLSNCTESFKSAVINWSRSTFENFHKKKKEINARIVGIQKFLQFRTTAFLLQLEKELTKEYQDILKMEEDMWFLKSRSLWIQKGDKNTRFFHVTTLKRRSYNRIIGLKNHEGSWCSDPCTLKVLILTHFQSLYSSSLSHSYADSFSTINRGPNISVNLWDSLIVLPTDHEMWNTIHSMKPWKALGPDGLHAMFFQKYWEEVKGKLCEEIGNVFSTGIMPDHWNYSFITLIPKTQNPELVSHFRPIGLCNVIYKIVTKIIVFRLKPIMGDLISPLQASFIHGRKEVDNVFILREFVYSFNKRKGRVWDMIVKLNLEKAYDRIEWSFIREALLFFKFPPTLIKMIMSCISSTKFSILINGGISDSFQPSRGIRQGDPLSPYLFMLCVEFLSIKLQNDIDSGGWLGSKIGKRGPTISHLFFADDLTFIGKATRANASYLINLLNFFCQRSGQKVNLSKSKVFFSRNVTIEVKTDICSTLNISETQALGKYLGFPITHKRLSKTDCSFIVDKVRSKLAGWKANMLSRAGRVTLVKSVLSAIPNYYMQGSYLPEATHKELDSLSRQIIWGSTTGKRKANLVSWDRLAQPKSTGGLGIKSSKEANQASMAKAPWRLLTKKEKLWSKAICEKYSIKDPKSNLPKSSPVLNNIAKGKHIIEKGIKWIPKFGQNIFFWEDNWVGHKPLKDILYGPFSLTCADLKVGDLILPNGQWDWGKISYPIPVEIKECIRAILLQYFSNQQDNFSWSLSSDGLFQSSSVYCLAKNIFSAQHESWNWIWKINTLPKIHHFIWLLNHGKLLTKDMLYDWVIGDSNLCPVCNTSPETIDHVFRECLFASLLWEVFTPHSVLSLNHELSFQAWLKTNFCLQSEFNGVKWNTMFSFIIWSIWALLCQIQEVHLHHIYREANAVADLLAKMGTTLASSFVILEHCPTDICNVYFLDVMGNSIPRNIII